MNNVTTFFYSPLKRGWLILVAATILGYFIGIGGIAAISLFTGLATLTISYWKARIVLLDFMELRHAPNSWRYILEAWLAGLVLYIVIAYWSALA